MKTKDVKSIAVPPTDQYTTEQCILDFIANYGSEGAEEFATYLLENPLSLPQENSGPSSSMVNDGDSQDNHPQCKCYKAMANHLMEKIPQECLDNSLISKCSNYNSCQDMFEGCGGDEPPIIPPTTPEQCSELNECTGGICNYNWTIFGCEAPWSGWGYTCPNSYDGWECENLKNGLCQKEANCKQKMSKYNKIAGKYNKNVYCTGPDLDILSLPTPCVYDGQPVCVIPQTPNSGQSLEPTKSFLPENNNQSN